MNRYLTPLVLALAALGGTAYAFARPAPADRVAPGLAVAPLPDERAVLEGDIAFYEERAAADSLGATNLARLGALYLQRARSTGNFTDVVRAESVAVRSLALRESRNAETYSLLVSARLARHDFAGALKAARALDALEPGVPAHRAILGEVLLETGAYTEATAVFGAIEPMASEVAVASRLVRWYELTGRLAHATRMARYLVRRLDERGDLPAEQQAWFRLRAGELALKGGNAPLADSMFRDALARHPGDYRVLAASARLAALCGDWEHAVALGGDAIAVQLDPATLGTMSEARLALGDSAGAAQLARTMERSALAQPGAIHRGWGLFLLDHGQRPPEVLKRVRAEMATRDDVYGYDLLAWTLHTMGRDDEAWPAMQRALAQGTEDAQLWYHAAAIAHARGDDTEARRQLSRVMAFNPQFHPLLAGRARALADSLGVGEP